MGGKTSTQEQSGVQNVDPTLRSEYVNMLNAFKGIASGGEQINQDVTVAGFTPAQEAAFSMGDSAATAFGFTPAGRDDSIQMDTNALGIKGYSPGRAALANVENMDPIQKQRMDMFYDALGTQIDDKAPETPDTGGGKGSGKGGGK
jgi:hypothetical protein